MSLKRPLTAVVGLAVGIALATQSTAAVMLCWQREGGNPVYATMGSSIDCEMFWEAAQIDPDIIFVECWDHPEQVPDSLRWVSTPDVALDIEEDDVTGHARIIQRELTTGHEGVLFDSQSRDTPGMLVWATVAPTSCAPIARPSDSGDVPGFPAALGCWDFADEITLVTALSSPADPLSFSAIEEATVSFPAVGPIPSPSQCTTPVCLVTAPDGGRDVCVSVRDAGGHAIPGATVALEFTCSATVCDPASLVGITNSSGDVTLRPKAGGCCEGLGVARIVANGLPIRSYDTHSSADVDNDGSVGLFDFAMWQGYIFQNGDCGDFTCDGYVSEPDFTLFQSHFLAECGAATPRGEVESCSISQLVR